MSNKYFKGFTLAEVLITLGIIGVVAAMTMPVLINSYNKRITETRLKKFYSVMNQAVERLKVDYGDLPNWEYFIDGDGTDKSELIAMRFKEYFGKYVSFVEEKEVVADEKQGHVFYMNDGSAIMTKAWNNYDYEFFPKNPEKCLKLKDFKRYGTCSFAFQFFKSRNSYVYTNASFVPYVWEYRTEDMENTDKLYNDSKSGCKNGTNRAGNYCGLIIMLNNWTVPKDYPRKLAY